MLCEANPKSFAFAQAWRSHLNRFAVLVNHAFGIG
jgi:hypothetical protein